jgi:hypothetical protein
MMRIEQKTFACTREALEMQRGDGRMMRRRGSE